MAALHLARRGAARRRRLDGVLSPVLGEPARSSRRVSQTHRSQVGQADEGQTREEDMTPRIVSHEEWLKAHQAHLAKEKAFTQQRDELARERRALPWERVEKGYVFEAPEGRVTLADLFAGRGQLLVQHFMFGPDWNEGCPSCSFWSDNFNGIDAHLAHRDT